jgi:uncharacterized protein YgiB involved in biofilm formation
MTHNSRMSQRPALILGTLITTAALITGCGEQADVLAFKSVDDCVSGGNAPQECTLAYQQAQKEAVTSAPRYTSKADCEEDYGSEACDGGKETPATPAPTEQAIQQPTPSGSHGGGVYVFNSMHPYYGGNGLGYDYYYPRSSGFAFAPSSAQSSRTKEAQEAARSIKPQPVFRTKAGETHLGNGEGISYGRQTMSTTAMKAASSPAKFSAGTSMTKAGSSVSSGGYRGGVMGSSGRSFSSFGG